MEPVPETAQALRSLNETSERDLASMIDILADRVVAIVPSCVGLSISLVDSGLTFTLVATSEVVAALDAVQYVATGPCVESAASRDEIQLDDVLDERRWQHFARAAAAQGVRSTLSLPLVTRGEIAGAVNLYAADPRAFVGMEAELRQVVGGGRDLGVSNADLPFRTRDVARAATRTLDELDVVEQAVGFVMAEQRIGADEARRRLTDAAERAGVDVPSAARALMARR
ncbi:GAF and ANTAR domain-containing protein [Cellulomonas sp. NS3]|uniref:GAF and ANTAR domain-containing protein n=1 Tax=Cellulomonas sp. NS3 TaxID=2973977 RepID=UPI0021620A8F|nr:GAF and ANTAR domain-containing protein [Cellulomonas sp. NS3]